MELRQKLHSFYLQSLRVWKVLKKPSIEEYKTVSKVSAIGLLALGFIGFVISLILKVLS